MTARNRRTGAHRAPLQWGLAVLVLALALTAGCAPAGDRYDYLGHQLRCMCQGCQLPLAECNHINCNSSIPMLKEVRAQLDAGESDAQILDAFVVKYSAAVRTSPPTKGFHWAAWITPFAVLLGGAFLAVSVVRKWKSASAQPATTEPADARADLSRRERVEEELSRFTPED